MQWHQWGHWIQSEYQKVGTMSGCQMTILRGSQWYALLRTFGAATSVSPRAHAVSGVSARACGDAGRRKGQRALYSMHVFHPLILHVCQCTEPGAQKPTDGAPELS